MDQFVITIKYPSGTIMTIPLVDPSAPQPPIPTSTFDPSLYYTKEEIDQKVLDIDNQLATKVNNAPA